MKVKKQITITHDNSTRFNDSASKIHSFVGVQRNATGRHKSDININLNTNDDMDERFE